MDFLIMMKSTFSYDVDDYDDYDDILCALSENVIVLHAWSFGLEAISCLPLLISFYYADDDYDGSVHADDVGNDDLELRQ